MNRINTLTAACISLLLSCTFGSCSSHKNSDKSATIPSAQPVSNPYIMPTRPTAMIPKARIYKTNGDYALNVPITLNESRDVIISFPAPSDITPESTPVALDNGFMLDRRGINANTAFLSISYSDYARLKSAPSIEELRKLIIPEARVTALYILPFDLQTAMNDMPQINNWIETGLNADGIKQILP